MICQAQMGLLVVRECGAPATAACCMCGRQVCATHTVMGQTGPACPDCAAANPAYAKNDDTDIAASRNEFYRPYGGAAAFGVAGLGAAAYFSASDSASMNQPFPRRLKKEVDYDHTET